MGAIGNDVEGGRGAIGEEGLAAFGGVAVTSRKAPCPVTVAVASTDAHTQAFERFNTEFLKGVEEEPGCHFFFIIKIDIGGVLVVTDAVEEAEGIIHNPVVNIPMKHDTEITVWGEGGRKRALDKEGLRIGLQLFQTDWGFEFADANLGFWEEPEIDISIEDAAGPDGCPSWRWWRAQGATAELGNKEEIDIFPQGALEDRPGPTEQKAVIAGEPIVRIEAGVCLDEAANAEDEISVRGAELEAVGADAEGSGGFAAFGSGFIGDFEFAFEDFVFLVELLESALEVLDASGIIGEKGGGSCQGSESGGKEVVWHGGILSFSTNLVEYEWRRIFCQLLFLKNWRLFPSPKRGETESCFCERVKALGRAVYGEEWFGGRENAGASNGFLGENCFTFGGKAERTD
jgi:hypothetical protein